MNRILLILLGIAVFAIPAAVPASQPANVRLTDLDPAAHTAVVSSDLRSLLADPHRVGEMSIVLPTGYTTLSAEFAG
jgi:hypothetical protein